MSVTLEVQQLATQLIEQGLMSQSEASKSIKLTATEPQKRLSCTSIKHASWTSTNPCSTCTHVVQDSKRIKSTKSKNPQKEYHTPNHPNTDETEVTTPWYLLVQDPLKEFEQHTRVAYDMMDEYPLDDDINDDEDEQKKNEWINAEIKEELDFAYQIDGTTDDDHIKIENLHVLAQQQEHVLALCKEQADASTKSEDFEGRYKLVKEMELLREKTNAQIRRLEGQEMARGSSK